MDLDKYLKNGAIFRLLARADGWYNSITGFGTTRDKGYATQFVPNRVLTAQECADLFHHDDLAERICSAIVDEALKKGYCVTRAAEKDDAEDIQERTAEVEKTLTQLLACSRVKEAAIWGRTMGGAAIFLGTIGSGRPEKPLVDEKAKNLEFLTVVERRQLQPATWYSDPFTEKFGQVETYDLVQTSQGAGVVPLVRIHETRLIMFPGSMTGKQEKDANNGWDYSVLQRVIDTLRKTNTSWDSVVSMMNDASQAVYKLKGLIDATAEEDKDTLAARLELMDQMRSTTRAICLDAEDEDFRLIERQTVAGVGDLVDKVFTRLAAAARMPLTILMGMSPGGLNATGESDLTWWYGTVKSFQEEVLKPRLERIVRIAAQTLYPGEEGDVWSVTFPELWEINPLQKAEIREKTANVDKTYVDMGALKAGEVALSRFAHGKFDSEKFTVNLEFIKQQLGHEYSKTPEQLEQEKKEELGMLAQPGQEGPPGSEDVPKSGNLPAEPETDTEY